MPRKSPISLLRALRTTRPDIADPTAIIQSGIVHVDGRVITNPASAVGPGSNIEIKTRAPLRGEAKLRAALDRFTVQVEGRIALDVGAAAGGFTRVLLENGAARVYAVDAGHGQLLGSLRLDARVFNLENTNLAQLSAVNVPEPVEIFTLDLSYISLTDAVPQLEQVRIHPRADLIALVKPMFELHLSQPPEDLQSLRRALALAREGLERSNWSIRESMDSPVKGGRGAVEFLLHCERMSP